MKRKRYKAIKTIPAHVAQSTFLTYRRPEYGLRDYMEIYNGRFEGHNFYIADIRYNIDTSAFEYYYDWGLGGEWYTANRITLIKRYVKRRK